MELPPIVDRAEFESANRALREKEKAATRARDALAAERRRAPMTEFRTNYEFDGPDGRVGFLDLFEGQSQLLVYHAWFPPGGEMCGGCAMFTDQVSPLAHLRARDTSFALVSTASQPELQSFRQRMGWEIPWYTPVGSAFQEERGTTSYFSLDVYLRDGDRAYLTYETRSRGVEALGSVWTFLDLVPFGRQEEWEDTPPGRPQGPKYAWWQLKDEYEHSAHPEPA